MAFGPGFDLTEALDFVSLCANIEYAGALPTPAGWSIIFDSPEFSQFNEKWQLWNKNGSNSYAIVIRGTVFEAGSILDALAKT